MSFDEYMFSFSAALTKFKKGSKNPLNMADLRDICTTMHCLNMADIVEKYKEAITLYSKVLIYIYIYMH